MTEPQEATEPEEIWDEKLERVELMASGDDQWDLSDNDKAALVAVLKDRQNMEGNWAAAVRQMHEMMAQRDAADAALAEAQQERNTAHLCAVQWHHTWLLFSGNKGELHT